MYQNSPKSAKLLRSPFEGQKWFPMCLRGGFKGVICTEKWSQNFDSSTRSAIFGSLFPPMVTRTAWSLDKATVATSTTGRRWSAMAKHRGNLPSTEATCQAQRQLAWLLITKLSLTWFMKWVFSNFIRLWSVLAPKRLKNLSKECQTILAKRHTSSCPSCDSFFHSIFFCQFQFNITWSSSFISMIQ